MKIFLMTSFIEVCEVYIYPSFPISLLYHNYIGYPLWVVDFLDKLSFQQFVHLYFIASLFSWLKLFIFAWHAKSRVYGKSAQNYP